MRIIWQTVRRINYQWDLGARGLIEITPWKVRMNNFYSQVEMHPKKRTSECSNKSIKIIQALSIVWCFHFLHSVIFSHFNSKIKGKWLWKYIVRPIRDTNDSTSLQCYNLSMYKINNLITHFEEKLYNYL